MFDGAMGTNLQRQNLTADDFGGLEGCSEALNLFCPQAPRKVHTDFLRAGCRVVESNTFGATRLVLQEYGLEHRVDEINRTAIRIAREAIEEARSPHRCFVAASIGPSTKLPTLGHIAFAEMRDLFAEQIEAQLLGGADLLVIETCQDLLQTKAALLAARRVFRKLGARCPVMISVTLEATGTMLLGSDIGAVTTILEPFDDIDAIGINCATGPLEMVRHVEYLSRYSNKPISVMPNAGLPENVNGKPFYRLTPAELAQYHVDFVKRCGVQIVGGCCGTTPEHLKAVAEAVRSLTPGKRDLETLPSVASLYHSVSLIQEPAPCMVGERTNANGSKAFRDLLLKDDWDAMTAMGREQGQGGAHLLDLSVAYVGRDEARDMQTLVPLFAQQVKLPLMIDSTEAPVIAAALERHPGRCIINSVNFEDGGKRLREVAAIAREFGSALICLTIDEEGMARTADRKLAIARRLFDTLTGEFGFRPHDLIFDPLTFTVGSGEASLRDAAVQTLEAVKRIKKEFPGCFTILGVSNVSFGLAAEAREVLNSVFLHEAVQAGLSLAIVNPRGIIPHYKIPEDIRQPALTLLTHPDPTGASLAAYMAAFSSGVRKTEKAASTATPTERLRLKILDGDRSGLESLLDQLRQTIAPLDIINGHLIPAMKEVGELFGRGEMQLPFVLQSAEAMKTAVTLLEKHMEKRPPDPRKKIVLATVRGDVHDIGKNLVDILLSNNGFAVTNLGIKVDIDTMIKAAQDEQAPVIGMSGLLVKSTVVMKENLEELNRRKFTPTVILGGAALTRGYVEETLQPLYQGRVLYARDAMDGLSIMQKITAGDFDSNLTRTQQPSISPSEVSCGSPTTVTSITSPVALAAKVPAAPFSDVRQIKFTLDEVLPFLDKISLFRSRWQYQRAGLSEEGYRRLLENEAEPALAALLERNRREHIFHPQASYGYFSCRRDGNDLLILRADGVETGRFTFPRCRQAPHLCLSDYFHADAPDLIGLWAVTVGPRASELAAELYKQNHYRDYLHLHGFSVELAETTAELLFRHMQKELRLRDQIAGPDLPRAGLRYSFGYPACPDLSQQSLLLKLVQAEKIGVSLTETFLMVPEQSVSGIFVHHPEAKYFAP